jgi:hypothetical protein
MNNMHTQTHSTTKKNICYRKREGEYAHARVSVLCTLFLSEQRATSERREKKKRNKKKKGEAAAIVTRASTQASERCRYILYWTRKSSNKAKD